VTRNKIPKRTPIKNKDTARIIVALDETGAIPVSGNSGTAATSNKADTGGVPANAFLRTVKMGVTTEVVAGLGGASALVDPDDEVLVDVPPLDVGVATPI
jgi:hypothetical protein